MAIFSPAPRFTSIDPLEGTETTPSRRATITCNCFTSIDPLEGTETMLQSIARELVSAVRRNATIDWTLRESVRARMRVIVKRILKKHDYPPDKQEKATQTVLEQAELLAGEWANS